MSLRRTWAALTLACFAALQGKPDAAEYVGPETAPAVSSQPVPSPTDTLRTVPRDAYESRPDVGVPMRSIFRDTRAPYYDSLRDWTLSPSVRVNESLSLSADIDLPDFRGSFPLLQRGFAPEDADLKVGPVYFKLRHISGAVLFSDNVEHSEEDRQSDVIGIMSIGGQILAQLSEGFQIAAAGNFVYLPFEHEAGLSGFALRAPYSFGITGQPTARIQLVWEPVLFGLPVTIADEFRIGMARFSTGAYDGFALFDGYDFHEYDRAGIYTFRGRVFPTGDEFRDRGYDEDTEFTYFSNEISATTGGPLPAQTMFRVHASHEDIWYYDDDDGLNLPSVRDQFFAKIESVREDLRFKPYARYEFLHRDNPDMFHHKALVGVTGPITDLLFFRGEIGSFWRGDHDGHDLIWHAGLYHTPSPYTWHSLEYYRNTTDFGDELEERVIYRITKTLGPELRGSAYTTYGRVEDLIDSSFDRTEWRSGVRLTYLASPKTNFRISGQHTRIQYEDEFENVDAWRARVECHHRFYERMIARAIYQYQLRNSEREGESYYENLLYFSLSWLF